MPKSRFVLLAILSGILLSLAWAGWMNSLILMVAFVPLLIIEDNLYKNRQIHRSFSAFKYSIISFSIWNIASAWWISEISVIGMVLVLSLNSICMASVFWLFHAGKRNSGAQTGYILFIFFWLTFEYLHIHWELSWPWLNLGNGFGKNPKLIQWYQYTGSLGGSLWVLMVNLLIHQAIKRIIEHNRISRALGSILFAVLIIIAPIIFSYTIYQRDTNTGIKLNIVLIQPNIDPYTEKFDKLDEPAQLDRILRLAQDQATDNVDFFIAPETALLTRKWEHQLFSDPSIQQIVAFLQNYPKAHFIIGAVTAKQYQQNEIRPSTARKLKETGEYYDQYNSALLISPDGEIDIYHKSQLVLGVERMPFPKMLGFLENLIIDLGGSKGSLGSDSQPNMFISEKKDSRIAPLICYESVYGSYLNSFIKLGANIVVVITNDGWWGKTPGYIQHLRYSQIRAIETNRYIARSANTGVTCFIDTRGELINPVYFDQQTAISGTITANNKITTYTHYGDYIGRIAAFICVLIILNLLAKWAISSKKKGTA